MTNNTGPCVGKKRKLPSGESESTRNGNMGQKVIENGDNDCGDDCGIAETISYVEFYSGVGGWTMALEEALHKLGPLLSSIRTSKASTSSDNNNNNNNNNATNTNGNDASTGRTLLRYQLKRLAALDHSDLCVKVFSHNFVKAETEREERISEPSKETTNKKQRKPKNSKGGRQKSYSIERMPLQQLEKWSADVWVMSPPCQPHTRQHNDKNHQLDPQQQQQQQQRKDLDDPRSKSFLKICEWLQGHDSSSSSSSSSISSDVANTNRLSDRALPSLIFLENVVGFESSNSFGKWRSALKSRGYRVGHFHLTPTQVGLPNDRPRFYTVAIRDVASGLGNSLPDLPSPSESLSLPPPASSLLSYLSTETNDNDSAPRIWKSIPELQVIPEGKATEKGDENEKISPISMFLDCNNTNVGTTPAMLRVPEKVLKNQSAWCFDIVLPSDRRSSCFTHSYGRFIRGTGSILYDDEAGDEGNSNSEKNGVIVLLPPEEREFQANWMEHLEPTKLRYFSGNELARLFGFSENFSFPSDTSMKQQWKLMGNSLNVRVASKLIELGFLLRYYYYIDEFGAIMTRND